jgi:hypothetical protein
MNINLTNSYASFNFDHWNHSERAGFKFTFQTLEDYREFVLTLKILKMYIFRCNTSQTEQCYIKFRNVGGYWLDFGPIEQYKL